MLSTRHIIQTCTEICGSQSKFAKELGVTRSLITMWLKQNAKIPAKHIIPIEKITNKQIKRWEIDPEIYPPDEYS